MEVAGLAAAIAAAAASIAVGQRHLNINERRRQRYLQRLRNQHQFRVQRHQKKQKLASRRSSSRNMLQVQDRYSQYTNANAGDSVSDSGYDPDVSSDTGSDEGPYAAPEHILPALCTPAHFFLKRCVWQPDLCMEYPWAFSFKILLSRGKNFVLIKQRKKPIIWL